MKMRFVSRNFPRRLGWLDIVVLGFIFILLYVVLKLGMGMLLPFSPQQQPVIDLSPSMLPYYAGRSLLRMFLAFGASLLFTLVYGYLAAKYAIGRILLVPVLDILQSVPVLGFLSATIAAFMALFPGSLLGVECAAIFAIFTGQAWNMTFSFYHALITLPQDLQEAAGMLHFNWWQRLVRLELPAAAIGLIWNSMMSFGGGWFFLAASEAITVLGQDIHLPGLGSYLAVAVETGNLSAMLWAMLTMLLVIVLVDQLFWRPLIVWGQRFKMELSAAAEQPHSFVYTLLQHSALVQMLGRCVLRPLLRRSYQLMYRLAARLERLDGGVDRRKAAVLQRLLGAGFLLYLLGQLYFPARAAFGMLYDFGGPELLSVFALGGMTALRVLAALLLGALWTIPLGVRIGLDTRLAGRLQPLIQMAASFPANMIFPFCTVLFVEYQVNFEYASVFLMMLGTQWYILFNVIAGAMSIPNDLLEAAEVFKLHGWKRWRYVILPAVFPQLVNGMITASGGAWNASIVSEMVSWRDMDLTASGLGAYISAATAAGNWPEIVVGIMVMCIFVVAIHRLLWSRLYHLSATRYHLD